MKLQTRQIVISGLLVAIALVMGATGVGFIPVPTPAGAATTMHLPVILAGILEGPYVGSLVGLIFGLFTLQFMPDPLVVIVPRLFIGVTAYLVYRATKKNLGLAAGLAALVGTLTNTVGVLGMAYLRGYYPLKAILTMAIAVIPEALFAIVITVPLMLILYRVVGLDKQEKSLIRS
ncbi:MAG TPA: ECF transporter S component [Clostridia bacterium]|jgi:uncharacterized membrane protein|nr:ECF transporter S component [Clostridia bacterium]